MSEQHELAAPFILIGEMATAIVDSLAREVYQPLAESMTRALNTPSE